MKGNVVKVVRNGLKFAKRNSNWLLAGLTVIGVTGVTWSAIKSTIKAVKLCEEKQVRGAKEVIKTTWKLYIPTAGMFILTTVAVIGNAKINANNVRRLATMTGLYAASQADYQSLKSKVKEFVGEKKAAEIDNAVAAEKVKREDIPKEDDIGKSGHGDMLFMDSCNGQFFRASPEWIDAVCKDATMHLFTEVDNQVRRGFITEQLGERESESDDLIFDLHDMQEKGHKEICADLSYTPWMDVNGRKERVTIMRLMPSPTGGY